MIEFLFINEIKRLKLRPVLPKIEIFHLFYVMKAPNVSAFSTAHTEGQGLNVTGCSPLPGN